MTQTITLNVVISKPPILQLEKRYLGKDLTNCSEIFRIYLSYYFVWEELRGFLYLAYKQSNCQNYQSYLCINFNLPLFIKFLKYSKILNSSPCLLIYVPNIKMIWSDK